MVSGVDMDAHSRQNRLDCLFGSTVKHLGTDTGGIRIPRNKDELARRTIIICLEFQINQTITAVIIWKLPAKVIVGSFSWSLLFNDDPLFVFNDKDEITKLEVSSLELEFIERERYLVVDYNSSGLKIEATTSCE